MRTIPYVLAALLSIGLATPSFAHHPGKRLDELMGSKEKYFQIVDEQAPSFALQDTDGKAVALADFRDKVVVLHFVYVDVLMCVRSMPNGSHRCRK